MARYLVSFHSPNNYNVFVSEDKVMSLAIDQQNDEMIAAGSRIFVGGLHPLSGAKSLQVQSDGAVILRDGSYLNTAEHIGGFWVLEATDLNEVLDWVRKAALACKASKQDGLFCLK